MVKHSVSVPDAFFVLGLPTGSSLEIVKSTYRQLALKTHPDKNPGNSDATEQFQRLSEAYNILLKHLDTSGPEPRARHTHRGGGSSCEDYDDYDEYEYDDEEDYEEDMAFYMYLFEEMMRGRGGRSSSSRYHHQQRPSFMGGGMPFLYPGFMKPDDDDEEEYHERRRQERLRQAQQNRQSELDQSREKAAAHRKAQQELDILLEEEKKEQDAKNKKSKAEENRKAATKSAQDSKQRQQTLRSAVFAAARSGDFAKVKKGIWEDQVDAAGGEIRDGCEKLVKKTPEDPLETLMHIAVKRDDKDLLEWLDSHNADPEERNRDGFTSFHLALQAANLPIMKYFFEAYPSKEPESLPIYSLTPPKSLLNLAVDTHVAEVVWIILEQKIVDQQEIADTWSQISSTAGKDSFIRGTDAKISHAKKEGMYDDVFHIVMEAGGFTPPQTPVISPSPESLTSDSTPKTQASKKPKNKRPSEHTGASVPAVTSQTKESVQNNLNSQQQPNRGRGRGRGRGGNRGRGIRGGPRGAPPS